MPRGHKIFDWSPQHEMKLLHAILAVHRNQIDCTEVAKVFGSDIPASCIVRHIQYLRGKAAAMGIIESKAIPRALHKNPVKAKKTNKSGKGKNAVYDAEDDEGFAEEASNPQKTTLKGESEDESEATKAHPPSKQGRTIGGRISKLRSSPRKAPKVNYQIVDRFSSPITGDDVDGDKISGKDKYSDDDTIPSDGEYTVDIVQNEFRVKAEI